MLKCYTIFLCMCIIPCKYVGCTVVKLISRRYQWLFCHQILAYHFDIVFSYLITVISCVYWGKNVFWSISVILAVFRVDYVALKRPKWLFLYETRSHLLLYCPAAPTGAKSRLRPSKSSHKKWLLITTSQHGARWCYLDFGGLKTVVLIGILMTFAE